MSPRLHASPRCRFQSPGIQPHLGSPRQCGSWAGAQTPGLLLRGCRGHRDTGECPAGAQGRLGGHVLQRRGIQTFRSATATSRPREAVGTQHRGIHRGRTSCGRCVYQPGEGWSRGCYGRRWPAAGHLSGWALHLCTAWNVAPGLGACPGAWSLGRIHTQRAESPAVRLLPASEDASSWELSPLSFLSGSRSSEIPEGSKRKRTFFRADIRARRFQGDQSLVTAAVSRPTRDGLSRTTEK